MAKIWMWLFLVSKAFILIIVKLQGGLGNQMFQYAIARSLSNWYKTDFALDHQFLESRDPLATHVFRTYDLDIFCLKAPKATRMQIAKFFPSPIKSTFLRKMGKLSDNPVVKEPFFHFFPEVFQLSKNIYLDGYWQSPRYFQPIEQLLRLDFGFCDPIMPESFALLNKIITHESVCVNIRRGDFLNNPYHDVCDMRYFSNALDLLRGKLSNPFFFVFSDDKEWCQKHFTHYPDVELVEDHHDGVKYGNKLQLMSLCSHFIIPNSTYAWWAVWLSNKSEGYVVAPQTWLNDPGVNMNDLLPDHWIRLKNV